MDKKAVTWGRVGQGEKRKKDTGNQRLRWQTTTQNSTLTTGPGLTPQSRNRNPACWMFHLLVLFFRLPGCRLISTFTIRIFESGISNEEVTFLLSAAEPLQRECVWSPGDVSLVIVNLSPLFLHQLLCGEQPSVRWGCEKPYTIPSNKPLWDLHVHCCKYLQAVCKNESASYFFSSPPPRPPFCRGLTR